MTDDDSNITRAPSDDAGLVVPADFVCGEPFRFELGGDIDGFTLRYETYGKLSADRSNAILVPHALTGDHHVAGRHTPEDKKPGWWDSLVGPGKPVDTDKFFVIGVNSLGGCRGSTGPGSVNPRTGAVYGIDFPRLTLGDMVRAQEKLISHLGIQKLHAVVGGSMGGMKALLWATLYPERVGRLLVMACSARQNAQAIAFNEVGRSAIVRDPGWANGRYTADGGPRTGLAVARMMAHITYLSDRSLERKFGREKQAGGNEAGDPFGIEFQVESYLRHQGISFIDRFDANTYLYITKAVDRFDLADGKPLELALAGVKARTLVVGFSSDWLYPPEQNRDIALALVRAGKAAAYAEIETDAGHDGFLLPSTALHKGVRRFLEHDDAPAATAAVAAKADLRNEADAHIFGEWIGDDTRVLDLGCGRGALLSRLARKSGVYGVGVDSDHDKVSVCLGHGVNAIQGDMLAVLKSLPDRSFDWVVCSRVLQELSNPSEVVLEALRVGKRVAVAFVNHGHWRNRVSMLRYGHRLRTGQNPNPWYHSEPTNPLSVADFEDFCAHYGIVIGRRIFLGSDLKTRRTFLPKLSAGYGVYELLRTEKSA